MNIEAVRQRIIDLRIERDLSVNKLILVMLKNVFHTFIMKAANEGWVVFRLLSFVVFMRVLQPMFERLQRI